MNDTTKRTCAIASTAALVATGLAGAATAVIDAPTPAFGYEVNTEVGSASAVDTVEARAVQGEFTYTQNQLSDMSVFKKAAATLCADLPKYALETSSSSIELIIRGTNEIVASIGDVAEAEGSIQTVMGCACSSNIAGGGAIGNAEVEGVAIENIYAMTK